MGKRTMNEQQMIDVIWGATLLGGGGGGSMASGMDILNKYKSDYPNSPMTITLYDVDEMKPNAYAAVTAGMGAPTKIKDVDFSVYATNAFMSLKDLNAKLDPPRSLEYSLAVELGGFNTFVPMLISLVNDIPFIDGDGAARAVPALDTLLIHVNGCNTTPLAMADGQNNRINVTLADPRDANLAEEICRNITGALGNVCGICGWMVNKGDMKERLACGTVTLSEKVGRVMRDLAGKGGDVFAELDKRGIANARRLTSGKVVKAENLMERGFDYGKVYIDGDNGKWINYFQNENLLIEKDGKAIMTVPDIIAFYDQKTGKPLTNADVKEGMDITVGAIQVHEAWWKNPNMFEIWKPFLNRVGYKGGNIPFEK